MIDVRSAYRRGTDVLWPFDRDQRRKETARRVSMVVCEHCLCPTVLTENDVEYCAGCDRRIVEDHA